MTLRRAGAERVRSAPAGSRRGRGAAADTAPGSGFPPPSFLAFLPLLSPRLLAARNAWRRSPTKALALAGAGLAFLWAVHAATLRLLAFLDGLGALGSLLSRRLLALLLLTLFAVLVVSSALAALSSFYLAGDMGLLLVAPLPARQIHHARFAETLAASSWMVAMLSLPLLSAYASAFHAGPGFALATLAVLPPFLVIPVAIGTLATTALVLRVPARRLRDGLLVSTGALVAAAFVAARALRPERLAEPGRLAGLASALGGLARSPSAFLPPTWTAEVLDASLVGRGGVPLLPLALLWSTALTLVLLSADLHERLLPRAWSRAQEGTPGAIRRADLAAAIGALVSRLPAPFGPVLAKDATLFLRDASQWSQLLLVLALAVIYVFNFSALPVDDGTAVGAALRDLAVFANLPLAAFVTTAVAVRFVYPMASLEGRAWWLVRTAPVPVARIWWSKLALAFVPLLALGETLVVATGFLLGASAGSTIVFGVTLVPLVAAIAALGIALGARAPGLQGADAARLATGPGAIAYMFASLALVAAVGALEAWPFARLLATTAPATPLARGEALAATACVGAALACTAAVFEGARRAGTRALAHLGA